MNIMKNTILSLFLIVTLSNARSEFPKNLQKVHQSVFIVNSSNNNLAQGTGFVIKGDILVTNFHVLFTVIENQMKVDSIYIINKEGRRYSS